MQLLEHTVHSACFYTPAYRPSPLRCRQSALTTSYAKKLRRQESAALVSHAERLGKRRRGQHANERGCRIQAEQQKRPEDAIDDKTARDMIGMGTWRLRGAMDPPFEGLTGEIEGLWRHMLPSDLKLYHLDKKYKFMDSLDPDRSAGMWGYADLPSPPKGHPKYPRMQIENRCYRSRVFRKLHIELAHRQDGLQIMHCVMFPRKNFDVPIVSFDMVAKNGKISLMCVDACPVAMDRSLPPIFKTILEQLQEGYHLENNRSVPEWGKEIFSDLCIIMRPTTFDDLANFIKYTIALVQAHLSVTNQTGAVQRNKEARLADIDAAHKRYCDQHLKNSSTRSVLAAAFSGELADEYMTKIMFDQTEDAGSKPDQTEDAGSKQDPSSSDTEEDTTPSDTEE